MCVHHDTESEMAGEPLFPEHKPLDFLLAAVVDWVLAPIAQRNTRPQRSHRNRSGRCRRSRLNSFR
jgi:hypothetical protein